MSTFTIYPRGFTSGPEDADTVEVSQGCPLVEALFNLYGHSQGNPVSMSFYDELLGYALHQFGDFTSWFDIQLSNPALAGPRHDYVIESVNFALNGTSRSMSQYSWSFILAPMAQPNTRVTRHYQAKKYLGEGISTTQILQRWCSQPQGAVDLLQTVYTLFGSGSRSLS